jgi:hypothetical protein
LATRYWESNFERSSDDETKILERIAFAQAIHKEMMDSVGASAGSSGTSTTSASGAGSSGLCGGASGGGGAASGSFIDVLGSYAWPTYKGLDITPTTGWAGVIASAPGKGRYIGGTAHPGIDCGGFTTNLVIDSGHDTSFNSGGDVSKGAGNTSAQKKWLDANWTRRGQGGSFDVNLLKAGDVAVNGGTPESSTHTFIYVGQGVKVKNAEGNMVAFESDVASASWDERAPMAGKESPADSNFTWYSKK